MLIVVVILGAYTYILVQKYRKSNHLSMSFFFFFIQKCFLIISRLIVATSKVPTIRQVVGDWLVVFAIRNWLLIESIEIRAFYWEIEFHDKNHIIPSATSQAKKPSLALPNNSQEQNWMTLCIDRIASCVMGSLGKKTPQSVSLYQLSPSRHILESWGIHFQVAWRHYLWFLNIISGKNPKESIFSHDAHGFCSVLCIIMCMDIDKILMGHIL